MNVNRVIRDCFFLTLKVNQSTDDSLAHRGTGIHPGSIFDP